MSAKRVLLIGSAGTVGQAVAEVLAGFGHAVVAANYEGEGPHVDITDTASVAALYERTGPVDAVACTVGSVPIKPLAEYAKRDVEEALAGKLSSQIDIVLQGLRYVRPGGSFTLISGIMSRVPWRGGIGASIVDGGIDAFVLGAAAELSEGRRINAVSPTILRESVEKLGFNPLPGHRPVSAEAVGQAFLRSIEGIETGRVFVVE